MKAIVLLGMLLLAGGATPAVTPQNSDAALLKSCQDFWAEFRAAVLANNKTKVLVLTAFPFQTRGETDGEPVKKHTKASFLKHWDKIFAADPGLSAERSTMRRLVEQKSEITPKDLSSSKNSFRVGNFVFGKAQGKWVFTMAYFD